MKKLIFVLGLLISLNSNLFSKDTKISFGLGASGFYGGAGVGIEYINGHLGILAGIGTVLNTNFLTDAIAFGVGFTYYFSKNKNTFYLGAAYGRTNNLGVERYSGSSLLYTNINVYYGPSFYFGYKMNINKTIYLRLGGGLGYHPNMVSPDNYETKPSSWIFIPDIILGITL